MAKKLHYFTPGPSQLYPTVPKLIRQAVWEQLGSISHRSQQFKDIFVHTSEQVKQLLAVPEGYQVYFLSSATEAMERVIQSCVAEYSFHLVNGAFSGRFYDIALQLGKQPEKLEVRDGQGFVWDVIDVPPQTELICATHNESSTGVMINLNQLKQLKQQQPQALVAVDVVSSAPYATIPWDIIDIAFFSAQKGFGCPAGLGVVVVGPRALRRSFELEKGGLKSNSNVHQLRSSGPDAPPLTPPRQGGGLIGSYHSLPTLEKYRQKQLTPTTPNVMGIWLLGQVAEQMNRYGIGKIKQETEKKAKLLYEFFDNCADMQPFVEDTTIRSPTIICVKTPAESEEIIKQLDKQGFVIGSGYGDHKPDQIRIGNYPSHKVEELERLLSLLP